MTGRIDQVTSFTYTTYIQATPERVWQGLTDPALMKRYWRHQKAGEKTFISDWKKGSTYDMVHEEVGLVVSDPEQVILESDPYRGSPTPGTRLRPSGPPKSAWTKPPLTHGGLNLDPRWPSTLRTSGTVWQAHGRPRWLRAW